MKALGDEVTRLLVRELEGFKREIALFPDDESMWRTVPGLTNSAANLAMHVAGGLQYLVGGVLGHSGYVRNREREFGQQSGSRAEVTAELDRAVAMVREVIPRLTEQDLAGEYPEAVLGVTFGTRIFLLHLCAHAAMHLGQAGYLRRALTGDPTSSGPLPLTPLSGG